MKINAEYKLVRTRTAFLKQNFMSALLLVLFGFCLQIHADEVLTTQSVIDSSSPTDWRKPDPENLLYLQLQSGDVVFELAPAFAPEHIANLRQLVADRYFDGLFIIRSQDNYVVQWGDPAAGKDMARAFVNAKERLQAEFYRKGDGLKITKLNSRDAYAEQVGFVDAFPVAGDNDFTWLAHCYGMLGVGRDIASDSGNGAELYVVTGHSPRHLDRNVTLIGRVLSGIEHLSSLPRGTGMLGFYESEKEYVKINAMRFGKEIPEQHRLKVEIMRTDTPTFSRYVQARTFRLHEWFVEPTGKIELCNVSVPVRKIAN